MSKSVSSAILRACGADDHVDFRRSSLTDSALVSCALGGEETAREAKTLERSGVTVWSSVGDRGRELLFPGAAKEGADYLEP